MFYFFTFLCFGLFVFTLTPILLDIYALFYFEKIEGNVTNINLSSRNLSKSEKRDDWYFLNIDYQYHYKSKTYHSNKLNFPGGVTHKNAKIIHDKIKKIVREKSLCVYVCPQYPSIAIIMPLYWNKLIFLGILFFSFITGALTILSKIYLY